MLSQNSKGIRYKDIVNYFFYFGKGTQSKCVSSSKHFLIYIGIKFGENEKQPIEDNTIIVTERTRPKKYASKKELEAEDWDAQLE